VAKSMTKKISNNIFYGYIWIHNFTCLYTIFKHL